MEVTQKELEEQKDSQILRDFLSNNSSLMDAVVKDAKTAQVWMSVMCLKTLPNDPDSNMSALKGQQHLCLFLCLFFLGGVWISGGVLWGESQNHSTFYVLPHVHSVQ